MTYATELAADWRAEIERIREGLPLWESGKMRMLTNGVDTTEEHIRHVRWTLDNLEKGVRILEGREV